MTEKEKREEIQYRLDCINEIERLSEYSHENEFLCKKIDEHAVEIMRLSN